MRGAFLRSTQEARDVVARPVVDGVVRLGIPEDFAAYRLAELLSDLRARRGRPCGSTCAAD